ncbi:TPA: hypothetical protein N5L20_000032 [Enterobacter kobei]|uniref:hypothetical protein n=1 Tax=Enterobacter TaxID=547 RepID=UPI0004DB42B2|nr:MULTISPECIES: hypothetical protein [Enterobacter]MBS7091219.1 hypothetical protein [Enterobacter cloacae]ELE9019834.1 hypothetical protein [Enterobacter kobei]ELE9038660.1 hypothetical protein [Enterobacter kobei]ELN9396758.1 hypothetical protein [Enterobacter kobei]ELQ8036933.1 hypothetical protein [Enterobacter kobei]
MKKVAFLVLGMMISGVAVSAEWHTSYKNDEMRGTAQKFSQTESDNAVDFDFPYNGGSKLTIVLRSKKTELKAGQKPESLPLTEAIIVISKGQFSCNSYDGCHVSAKFDDGKIQRYAMSGAADGSSDVIFFDNSSSFIKNLKTHKKLILEADFFQSGSRQFKYDLTGLKTEK